MNKVFINGRFLTQPLSGMQRYAEELLSALDAELGDSSSLGLSNVSFEVLVPQGMIRRPGWKNLRIRQIGRMKGHAWEQFELYFASRAGVLVNLTSCGPLLHRRSVLAMHDAAIFEHPEHFSLSYRTWHRFIRPKLARRACSLITISEFSRRELAKFCGVNPASFTIVPDSAEHILHVQSDDTTLQRFGLTRGAYALTVGNQTPNKNIALAISAFEMAAPDGWMLAVAGGGADKIFGQVQTEVSSRVRALGRVSDEELRALYEGAGLFLFPSRYEGFGVPPLEAMSTGCAVLSSDSSAMPEVLGDAAAYFRSDDVDDFSRCIASILKNQDEREQLIEKGRLRAASYSWKKGGGTLSQIIKNALAD